MDRLVHTALNALTTQRDTRVTQAQNLANMNVPGFRKDIENEGRTYFATALDSMTVRAFQTETGRAGFLEQSGPLQPTGGELDIAVVDDGYFFVQPDDDFPPALSRRGDLRRSLEGILMNGAGETMLDNNMNPIEVPEYEDIQVTEIGEIWITQVNAPDGAAPLLVGTLGTVVPDEDMVLLKSNDGQIRLEDGTLPPANQMARLTQGVLEGSNVNTVEELVASIELQRNFELGMRMIQNASKLDEAAASLLRAPE